jgi:diguanylate cyclase (GGDEF)-like protein
MKSHANPRPLTFQVTLTVLALAVFTLLLVVSFGFFATISADNDALQRQKAFVGNGLQDAVNGLMREQESIAVWDDAVNFAKAHDQQWMSENIGEWMYTYYGHDRAFVLDDHDQPVHAMEDGKTLAPARYADTEPVAAPAVHKLRALMAEIATSQDADPPKSVAEDLVSLDGKPAILSVMPLVPSTPRLTQEPGSEYLHVAVKFIDERVVGNIARQFKLADARVLPLLAAPAAASVPLIDSRGVILGYIGWTPDRPGLTLIRKTGPALLGGAALGAGMLWFLLARLRRASSALQSSQDHAQFLAFHDRLTGLPNRALFEDRLKRALVSAQRQHSRIALLYIDLDRFKTVNDTLGHPAGDELVRQTARRLESRIREVDTVARLGGDEFAIVLVDIRNVGAAEDLSAKLLEDLSRPFLLMGDQVFIGASIGIAISPDIGSDPDDLLRKADIALYEAKKNGRGRYQLFAGDMDDILTRRRLIESELRTALDRGGELRLAYQPVYASDCQTIVGAEALVRWEHPIHGALPPAHFIGIAEERGMIGPLGSWVLGKAARFVATTDLPWVAVNVSPLQLRDEAFARELLEIIGDARLDPTRLQIEITESVLLEDSDIARTALSTLRNAGIRVALDDFGTGYSSINYLRHYAVDKLKIDRSFIRQVGAGDDTRAIVEAMVRLARALKMQVTIEGVETAEQRDMALAIGCDELQGFLLAPPMAEAQMRETLSAAAKRQKQRTLSAG